MRTHVAHVDGLQTSHATVILNLNTGKIAKSIRQRMRIETLQLLTFQTLGRDNLFVLPGHDNGLIQKLHTVQPALCL